MKLRELLLKIGINEEDLPDAKDYPEVNYELVCHEAGEQADEVVEVQVVPEVHSIYMEYE